MKTAEEFLRDFTLSHPNVKAKNVVLMLMKSYSNGKLEQASQIAKAKLISNNESVWYSDIWAEVDKESILSLKDEL